MGILDDAIREHLELKRRHGADASEIARQEREALGPVVRGELDLSDPGEAATAFHDAAGAAPALAVEPAIDEERPFFEKPAERPRAQPVPPPVAAEPAPAPAPVPAPDTSQHTVAFSLDELEAADTAAPADPPAPTPAPAAAVPPAAPAVPPAAPAAPPAAADERPRAAPVPLPAPTPPLDQPVEDLRWDAPAEDAAAPREVAPDVVPADAEPGEHDELEETPEFLQETPEHDRLWFEQRPPRDFDF